MFVVWLNITTLSLSSEFLDRLMWRQVDSPRSHYGIEFALRTVERECMAEASRDGVSSLFDIQDRVFLVSGGTGRLGTAMCRGLAQLGARVHVGARNMSKAEDLSSELRGESLVAHAAHLDLSNDDSIDSAVGGVVERDGRIDCLVNAAVSHIPGDVLGYATADWEASMRVDATGFFRLTQQCLNAMLQQQSGSIVTISSILGSVGPDPRLYPNGIDGMRPHYFFAKAGVIGFTKFLAAAYARAGIRVNCVSPGGFAPAAVHSPNAAFADRVPMGRLATPEEFLGAVVFLASSAGSYVTGHDLVVDGGYTAW